MSSNFLSFNSSKTEVVVFGPQVNKANVKHNLGYLNSFIKPTVKNLGVLFDTSLKLLV